MTTWMNVLQERYRYSVSAKINTIFAITILIFVFFLVYNNYALNTSNLSYNKTINHYYDVAQLKQSVAFCEESVNEYLRNNNRTSLVDFNKTTFSIVNSLDRLNNDKSNIETLFLTESIHNSFETYLSVCNMAFFKYYENDYDFYTYEYRAQTINRYLQKYCDELLLLFLGDGEKLNAEMLTKQKWVTTFSSLSIVIIIVLFIASVAYVNIRITSPLNSLSAASKKIASGDFDVQVHHAVTRDTVGVLFVAFNVMTQNIKQMMLDIKENANTEKSLLLERQKNVEYQQMLSTANFLALQSQTNPHFLFNTLNSISRTITLGMSKEAVSMIDSMVTLLRYNLTDADMPVTLEQELLVTKEYLKIQQYRFRNRIFAEIDCDKTLSTEIVLPRFTLQPLVENAIIHGLEPKEEGGTIKIIVRKSKNKYIIKVIDDGMGITPKRLRAIQETDQGIGHTNSIGVSNTKKRIQLFTKNDHSFKLKSSVGMGTEAIILLPAEQGDHNV